jgi:hypothetical protein
MFRSSVYFARNSKCTHRADESETAQSIETFVNGVGAEILMASSPSMRVPDIIGDVECA